MQTQHTASSTIPDQLTGPLQDIATMFADMGIELGRFSEQIHIRLADIETARQTGKEESGRTATGATSDRRPPPTSSAPSAPVPLPGEPVDTSYARPVETPAANAAGASPYSDPLSTEPPAASRSVDPPSATSTPAESPAATSRTGQPKSASRIRPTEANPAKPESARPARPQSGLANTAAVAFAPTGSPRPPAASRPPEPPLLDRLADWTSRHGTKLLAWAGGAVTLLGIVLLLVMAVQQGWLGPIGRVLGGAGLGSALLIGGWRVHRESAIAGAFALVATGIATLYLDVLAATALYGFLPAWAGLGAGLVLAGGGLWLADRWRSQVLAIGVVLGCALCAPLLFGAALAAGTSMALLTAFLVLLKIASTPVQMRRGWPALTVASTVPAILSALVGDVQAMAIKDPWPAAGASLAVAGTGIVLAAATARRRPRDPAALVLLLLAGAPALFAAPLLDRWADFGVVMAVAALYFALWFGQKFFWHKHLPARLGIAAGGACALAVLQASITTVDGSARSVTLLGEATVLALLAIRLRSRGILLTSTVYGSVGALVACAGDIPPTLFFGFPARPFVFNGLAEHDALVPGLLAFLLLGLAAVTTAWSAIRLKVLRAWHPVLWISGLVLLYGSGGVVLSGCLLVSPTEGSFLLAHALITLFWVVAAFWLLLRGVRSVPHRTLGFILIFAALGKLALFDLAALSGLARVSAFLGAGLMLLVGGTRYARLIAERT